MTQLFPLGQIVITTGAADTFHPTHLRQALHRHAVGDWGEVCEDDRKANEHSLKHGSRLLSAYTFREERLWAITEADRSATTLLLPEEY